MRSEGEFALIAATACTTCFSEEAVDVVRKGLVEHAGDPVRAAAGVCVSSGRRPRVQGQRHRSRRGAAGGGSGGDFMVVCWLPHDLHPLHDRHPERRDGSKHLARVPIKTRAPHDRHPRRLARVAQEQRHVPKRFAALPREGIARALSGRTRRHQRRPGS